jgi:cyclopropane fatty-acyl-phospholipid synthase-like methyltransferase
VLDVGCGAGAASLALVSRAGQIIGVDTSPRFLEEFAKRGRASGLRTTTIHGRWPDVAAQTPNADVVVCHHVVYNVPDLQAFASALSEHGRSRVVLEMTLNHPRSHLNDLWVHFHHLPRPERPTADDAVAVLREIGLDVHLEVWTPTQPSTWFESLDEAIAWNRRQLCLLPSEDAELAQLLRPRLVEINRTLAQPPSPRATVWWDPRP